MSKLTPVPQVEAYQQVRSVKTLFACRWFNSTLSRSDVTQVFVKLGKRYGRLSQRIGIRLDFPRLKRGFCIYTDKDNG